MDGTENGELVPLFPVWSVLRVPFLFLLLSFSPVHAVKPFLVSYFVSQLFKGFTHSPSGLSLFR